ncbi:MAG TPA: gas vesicle protein GvpJ [Candidatus Angelobacter sp.]|jgi:hypothetical protein|nr:gas vesicle protein GvpJ [Candidatus Angelobacter sp.]
MHLSTDFATENDLLDRVMDKGIVVEVWDRLGLAAIDVTRMQISVSMVQLFIKGKNPPAAPTYFMKVDRS